MHDIRVSLASCIFFFFFWCFLHCQLPIFSNHNSCCQLSIFPFSPSPFWIPLRRYLAMLLPLFLPCLGHDTSGRAALLHAVTVFMLVRPSASPFQLALFLSSYISSITICIHSPSDGVVECMCTRSIKYRSHPDSPSRVALWRHISSMQSKC